MYSSVFGSYEATALEVTARQLLESAGFSHEDHEDILQELSLYLIERLPDFDPQKSSHKTFVFRLLRNKVNALKRYRTAQCRDYRKEVFLPQSTDPEEKNPGLSWETLGDKSTNLQSHADITNLWDRIDLAIDILDVIQSLPAHLQEICILLREYSVAEISRRLNLHRDTVHQHILAIRGHFKSKGLEEYLNFDPTLLRCLE